MAETKSELQEQLDAMKAELAQKDEQLNALSEAKEAAANVDPGENPNRRVTIQLFQDNDKYKEPLYVSVNDYRAAIPRGMRVEVPYFVAQHIAEMQEQDSRTASMVQMLTGEYEQRSKVMG